MQGDFLGRLTGSEVGRPNGPLHLELPEDSVPAEPKSLEGGIEDMPPF